MKSEVVVLGSNHHNTLGVIRSLGRCGLKPYVILIPQKGFSNVLASKYIKRGWVVQNVNKALSVLLEEFSHPEKRIVVIACSDKFSSMLDMNRTRLSSSFLLPGIQVQGRVTELMDKFEMCTVASNNGLIVPQMFIIKSEGIKNNLKVEYPCIVKPLKSITGTKNEINILYNSEQLRSFFQENRGHDYLIQTYIDKNIEFQLIGCSINSGEEVIIPGRSVIMRQPSNTNTGFLHYNECDRSFNNTVERTKAMIKAIGYSGLFSAEFIRGRDGKDYFLEINFRNDGNSIAVTSAGVNLPYIWYLSCIGADYKKEIRPVKEQYVMPEFDELALLCDGRISFKQWRADMRLATTYMDYAPDDLGPTKGWRVYKKERLKVLLKYYYKKYVNN